MKNISDIVVVFNGKISRLVEPRPILPYELSVVELVPDRHIRRLAPEMAEAAVRALCPATKVNSRSSLLRTYGKPVWLRIDNKLKLLEKPDNRYVRPLPDKADAKELKFMSHFADGDKYDTGEGDYDWANDVMINEIENFMDSPYVAIWGGGIWQEVEHVPEGEMSLNDFMSEDELAEKLAYEFECHDDDTGGTDDQGRLRSKEAVKFFTEQFAIAVVSNAGGGTSSNALWCEMWR